MDVFFGLWIFLIGIIGGLLIGVALVHTKAVRPLHLKIKKIEGYKRSQSSIYGRITEQFAPFMKKYPFNPEKFRFLGEPIDGIQFEDDKIIFVEFKTRRGELSGKQKTIKQLIEANKVGWYQFHIGEKEWG